MCSGLWIITLWLPVCVGQQLVLQVPVCLLQVFDVNMNSTVVPQPDWSSRMHLQAGLSTVQDQVSGFRRKVQPELPVYAVKICLCLPHYFISMSCLANMALAVDVPELADS